MAARNYTADGENVSQTDEDLLFENGFSSPQADEEQLQEQYNKTDRAHVGVDACGGVHTIEQDRYGRRVVVVDPDGDRHMMDATGRGFAEYVAFITQERGGWEELHQQGVEKARSQLGIEPLVDGGAEQ